MASKEFERSADRILIGAGLFILSGTLIAVDATSGTDSKAIPYVSSGIALIGFGFTYSGFLNLGSGSRKLIGINYY
jgi:hypothetical protein